jgi:hypothetical protein
LWKAHLDLATVARVGHHAETEGGMRKEGASFKALPRRIRTGVPEAPSAEKRVIVRSSSPHPDSLAGRPLLTGGAGSEGVLLLARIAVHATNLASDDGVDGVSEDELAPIAPGVDVAPDEIAGHAVSKVLNVSARA